MTTKDVNLYPQEAKVPGKTPRAPDEESRRTGRIIGLGIVILLGFAMPSLSLPDRGGNVKFFFPNFQILAERTSGTVKFLALYPGIAAMAVIALGLASKGIARSLSLVGLGALPLLIVLGTGDMELARQASFERVVWSMKFLLGTPVLPLPFSAMIWGALFVCGRTLHYRPRNDVAGLIGALGGVVCFITFFVPVDDIVWFIVPFKHLVKGRDVCATIVLFVQMCCMISASVLCVVCQSRIAKSRDTARLGDWVFGLMVLSIIASATLFIRSASLWNQSIASWDDVVRFVLDNTKTSCLMLGAVLLLPFGVTDLLVNVSLPIDTSPARSHESDSLLRLEALKAMLDRGLITSEDYDRKKREILDKL